MTQAKISSAQAMSLRLARAHATDADRKAMKKEVFASAKDHFGIPVGDKLTVEIEANAQDYCVLKNVRTRTGYDLGADGKWVGAVAMAATDKQWHRLPMEFVANALADAIEAANANGVHIQRMSQRELDDNDTIMDDLDINGVVRDDEQNMWVLLDADFLGETDEPEITTDDEEEDERPY